MFDFTCDPFLSPVGIKIKRPPLGAQKAVCLYKYLAVTYRLQILKENMKLNYFRLQHIENHNFI